MDSSGKGSAAQADAEPWREALAWMLSLSLLFMLGYSASNRMAAASAHPASWHGPWDAAVPFWAWTIWPYLALNLMFPCTFFAFDTVRGLRAFAARIAAVQLACFASFVLAPTFNVRTLPQPDGVTGMLFSQLRAFEQPVNMFPSLHAAVLLLVWRAWLPRLRAHPAARLAWHGWCLLILISTVTTWQHDLADIAAGLALGGVALALPLGRLGKGAGNKKPAQP